MADWQDDYETNPCGVDPNDYSNQDDFMDSLRNNERRMNAGGQNNEGCYIATCVYGSYDCPQVLVLRQFRDNVLKQRYLGRAFIKVYYALSPKLVKTFGQTQPFQRFFRRVLDRLIKRLENR